MALAAVVFCGFVVALAAPMLPRSRALPWLLALVPAGAFAYLLAQVPGVRRGEPVTASYDWVPALDINLAFRADGLSLLMGLLITGIGALIVIYTGSYMAKVLDLGRFYGYLLAFMASMLGLVFADDLIVIFVFWELTSITSFLLIGFESHRDEARKAAVQALLVTAAGGLALMGGFVLLGEVAGTYQVPKVLDQSDLIRDSSLYLPILLLVLAGAFTKSAMFPFHFWLPAAMAAPTPVSAYLHSATMVKAGIYLLARLHPALGGTDEWTVLLVAFGSVTMVIGGFLAAHQTDLKLILAYSTVAALGLLVLLLGIGDELAVKAVVVFLLAHSLYKGGLFLVAGIIDHETGTRDVQELGGLRRAMPVTAITALIGALSLAGIGPLVAFIGKEALLEAVLESGEQWQPFVLAAVVLSGAFFAVAAVLVLRPMVGQSRSPGTPHEAPFPMLLGPMVLALASLVLGVAPAIETAIVRAATAAIAGEEISADLALWHGVNTALLLSLLSVGLGVAFLMGGRRATGVGNWLLAQPWLPRPSVAYDGAIDGLNRVARWHTRTVQHGYLRIYLTVTLAVPVVLMTGALLFRGGLDLDVATSRVTFYELMTCIFILVGATAAVVSDSRLAAVVALGVVGFGVALLYAFFGAPDLALTQFIIETLTVLLFVLVFYRLPQLVDRSKLSTKVRDAALSLSVGGFMALLVLASLSHSFAGTISGYFIENSVTAGFGRNVVNVILVDFRALDTFGEIVVLSIASVGVYALLRWRDSSE